VNSSFSNDLRCPDDGHLLQANTKGRVPFAACRHCDGVWFTKEAIHSRLRAALPEVRKSSRKKPAPKSSRACPQCSSKLDLENVDGVVINVCPQCGGVWLEPGEYKAARRRSVKMRLHKEAPFLRPRTSKVGIAFDRMIDFLGYVVIEFDELTRKTHDEPPLRLTPRPKRPRR
jgi:Zn-finger nucleic acid-binding protein